VITLLRTLVGHQAWADAAILNGVQAHPESARDEQLLKTLHHVVMVQRIFLALMQAHLFDHKKESQQPESFDQLVELYRVAHEQEEAFVDGLQEGDLERRFDLPFLGSSPTIAESLTQVVMHGQNHRGQCLTRIREKGAKPPTLDYILWVKDRPTPVWPQPKPIE